MYKRSPCSCRVASEAYGSIAVYFQKRPKVKRFIGQGLFVAGGKSGSTRVLELRDCPKQCYNCQHITNHQVYQCA
ncbi:Uncharacterized protein HZ326_15218 [Fusarium oxysporum f. sp. albedinis]|nr:Uncharacterized protein HZ326_15218 [Fusarium oxysporum f. sp. albedinis]